LCDEEKKGKLADFSLGVDLAPMGIVYWGSNVTIAISLHGFRMIINDQE